MYSKSKKATKLNRKTKGNFKIFNKNFKNNRKY